MSEKYFTILVNGREAAEAEEGELNKTTGLPDGKTSKIKLQVGAVAFPNFSKVWGRRVLDKKTNLPTGEIEFMPWGARGGELIAIRYLEGCPSLDKHYQKNTLKIELSQEEQQETAYIDLNIGVNDFDLESADPMFIEMLKHHTYCKDNESRKSSSREVHFEIYDATKISKEKITTMREMRKAQDIIFDAEESSDMLMVLAKLFDIDPQYQDEVIFKELVDILEDDYKRVLKVINMAKDQFRDQLTALYDKKILQDTPEGDIFEVYEDERKELIRDIDAKDKIAYLVANMFDAKVYAVRERVSEITDAELQLLN